MHKSVFYSYMMTRIVLGYTLFMSGLKLGEGSKGVVLIELRHRKLGMLAIAMYLFRVRNWFLVPGVFMLLMGSSVAQAETLRGLSQLHNLQPRSIAFQNNPLQQSGALNFSTKAPVEIVYSSPTQSKQTWASQRLWLIWGLLGSCLVIALLLGSFWFQRQRLKEKMSELDKAYNQLHEAQEIAQMGSWSRDFSTGESYWSPEARKVLALGEDQASFKHYETLIHPEDFEHVLETIANAYHKGGAYVCEHRVICPDGVERYISLAGQVFLDSEGSSPVRETGTVQDVTLRREAEAAIKVSEIKLRSILEAAPYPIMICESTDRFEVRYANQSTYYLFEMDLNVGLPQIDILKFWVHEDDRLKFQEQLRSEKELSNFEILMKTSKGKVFWGMISATDMDFGGEHALFISLLDVTDRRLIQEELERLATTDPLTGILNRRSFFEYSYKEVRRAVRYQYPFCLLMMDIDYFKQVNDTYGHAFGDQVLQRFTEVVIDCLREEDIFGRIGGEEFAAVLVASNNEGGYIVAERIRKQWEETTFEIEGKIVSFSVSIGVSELLNERESVEMVLERADKAVYSSKESGRNCVTVLGGAEDSTPSTKIQN